MSGRSRDRRDQRRPRRGRRPAAAAGRDGHGRLLRAAPGRQGGQPGDGGGACARRAERNVVMVGAVGDDDLGVDALRALEAEGVDVSVVRVAADAATGVALIAVDEHGREPDLGSAGRERCPRRSDRVARPLAPGAGTRERRGPGRRARGGGRLVRRARGPVRAEPGPVAPALRDLLDRTSILTRTNARSTALSGAPDPLEGAARAARRPPGADRVVTLGIDGAIVVDDERRGTRSRRRRRRRRFDRRRRLLQRRPRGGRRRRAAAPRGGRARGPGRDDVGHGARRTGRHADAGGPGRLSRTVRQPVASRIEPTSSRPLRPSLSFSGL